jgi:hypothetical protein
MASSNIADLVSTTSSTLQNWDAEWAAAENGKIYWDDYLSQITADYNNKLGDINLDLQDQQIKYDAALADIDLDLQAPQIKYDAAVADINLNLQNNLSRVQTELSEANKYYISLKNDFNNENYAQTAKNKFDAAVADINLNLQNNLSRSQIEYSEALRYYSLLRDDPTSTGDDIEFAFDDVRIAEHRVFHWQEVAFDDKQHAQRKYDEEKAAAKLSAENDIEMAFDEVMMAEDDEDHYNDKANEAKQDAQSKYDTEKAAAKLSAEDETTIAKDTYDKEVAAAEALVEQQKAQALDDYKQILAKAESAKGIARSEFNSNQEAAAVEAEAIAAAEAEAIAAAAAAKSTEAETSSLDSADTATTSESDGGLTDQANATTAALNTDINLDQRHTVTSGGDDILKLSYTLKGYDNTDNPGGDASILGVKAAGLTNVAVLGPNTSSANSYSLEISAESLKDGWNLESTDIVLKYNADLFDAITAADITLSTDLPSKNSISIDDENGLIRFAAASLGDLSKGSSIFGENILASINVNFDETYFNDTARKPDDNGKFTFNSNPLSFDLSANSDETIFSRTFQSDADGNELANGAFTNRDIQSLGDLNGITKFEKSNVNLYQAEIKFDEQEDGLTFGTKRVIGANRDFTNLIRKNDIVTAQTSIENIGNSLAQNVTISSGTIDNAKFSSSRFLDDNGNELIIDAGNSVELKGGEFDNEFNYNSNTQESVKLEIGMEITGKAGTVIDVTQGLFEVSASGMNQNPETEATPDFFVSESGSKNLITFQGDLNYDGRVSMKDLAFLNAGAARQQLVDGTDKDGNTVKVASDDSYARDVDADFSGKIDLADLTILDADWGKTLHNGEQGFTGSSNTFNWTSLAEQDGAKWDNSSFTAQNAIEADAKYIGSLEPPVVAGTIGADNSSSTQDAVTGEETDQGSSGLG